MKNLIVILMILLLPLVGFSYTWVAFSPDTIDAKNIVFGVGGWHGVICTDDGMYLYEEDLQEWVFYTYGLPVKGAAVLNNEKILVVMGNGSYSDGVYTFDRTTHEFTVVEWIINPNFLLHYYTEGTYYVGYQFGGMFESSDGYIWTEVPYFSGISCAAMDFYDNHLVVLEVSNLHGIYWSDDSGATWNESTGSIPMITELNFGLEGDLMGIFPSYSNSSGLYSSADYGQTWDLEFWSDNMSAVCFDAMGNVLVGWESPTSGNQGVAIYTPNTNPPELYYLNEGLPNININKIVFNPYMSAIAIFVCTDAGIYMSYDYWVGTEENKINQDQITVYPNPVSAEKKIRIEYAGGNELQYLDIYTNEGKYIYGKELKTPTKETTVDLQNLQSGIYFLRIQTDNSEFTEKLVIH
jgi:hypothetical protein